MARWQTLSSQVVFHRRHVRIVEDRVRLPDGLETDYLVLRAGPGVAVLAITDHRRVVLVSQYRYPIDKVIYELPGGGIKGGESLADAARRELREETGFDAADLVPLGSFFPSPARASTEVHVFLGRHLSPVPRSLEPTEGIALHLIPWPEALALVARNELQDATTVFALFMAEKKGLVD